MPRSSKRPPALGPTRYRYEDVVANVQSLIDHPESPPDLRKRLVSACGLDSPGFSHRMTQYRGERFRIEHFGAMAIEAKAPEPWPFVDWATAQAFQAFRSLFNAGKK